jgi:ribosomal 50S subunit-associated protein YjgA (DUF615 family)
MKLSLPTFIVRLVESKPIHWRLWIASSVLLPGSAVLWASTQLLWLPDLPNCWVISWSDASSATRLYCAQELGNRQEPEDLRQAIRLLNGMDMEDPQRPEADRLIQQLSETTLRLAESAYQEGDLNAAITIAQKIPKGIWTYRLANRNVLHWKATWAKAESIYQKAEKQIDKRQWYTVLTLARELLRLDNRYWETTKYPELMRSLQFAKESTEWQVSTTDVATLKRENVKEAIDQVQHKQTAASKSHLQKAQALAQSRDPEAIRTGIDEARSVLYGTPHYEEAQALIATLQTQAETLENRPHLDRATDLARKGDPESLQAAIDEANQITWGSPLYEQANEHIEEWRDRLYQSGVQSRTQQLEQNLPNVIPVTVPTTVPESLPLPIASPTLEVSNENSEENNPVEHNLDEPIVIEVDVAPSIAPSPTP